MTKPDELSTDEAAAKKPKLTPDQAQLLAGATMVENSLACAQVEHDEDGNPVEPEEPVDKVAGNRALLEFLVAAATPVMPFLPECYTPDAIGNIAGAFTAVEEKYGWDIGSGVGPELALAMFALPPSLMAYQMGKLHFAEKRAQREAAERSAGRGAAQAGIQDANKDAIGG